jgi:putative mRNA 3-end processing factor
MANDLIINDDTHLVIPQVLKLHQLYLSLAPEQMIIDDFVVFDANGLYCKYGDFYLDPKQPVNKAVITHAHADHAVSGNHHIYTTAATLAFMQLRYGKSAGKIIYTADYNTAFNIGDVQLTFIPAGHMPGSAQILMEYQGTRYLYTGDYKLQPDTTCEPYRIRKSRCADNRKHFCQPGCYTPRPGRRDKKTE